MGLSHFARASLAERQVRFFCDYCLIAGVSKNNTEQRRRRIVVILYTQELTTLDEPETQRGRSIGFRRAGQSGRSIGGEFDPSKSRRGHSGRIKITSSFGLILVGPRLGPQRPP